MAKQVAAKIKLQAPGGQATPAPPIGPALGQHNVNIGQFVAQFNERTRDRMGVPLPIIVHVYRDGSFDFEVKSPPASYLIKREAEVAKGSGLAGKEEAGTITREQLRKVAEEKMEDLNAADLEAAARIMEGTARSCGIRVED